MSALRSCRCPSTALELLFVTHSRCAAIEPNAREGSAPATRGEIPGTSRRSRRESVWCGDAALASPTRLGFRCASALRCRRSHNAVSRTEPGFGRPRSPVSMTASNAPRTPVLRKPDPVESRPSTTSRLARRSSRSFSTWRHRRHVRDRSVEVGDRLPLDAVASRDDVVATLAARPNSIESAKARSAAGHFPTALSPMSTSIVRGFRGQSHPTDRHVDQLQRNFAPMRVHTHRADAAHVAAIDLVALAQAREHPTK